MRALPLSAFFLLLWMKIALAALTFPQLTGRVVDDAHMLSPRTAAALEEQLAAYEAGTGNQLVVVTLASLQDHSIEDYGYQLGRYWGIGQKGKNNGVLLIIAPKERKVRIEVGYGLEGTLTDAVCSEIIQGIILPQFRAGHMEQGVTDGAQAIMTALGGQSAPPHQDEQVSPLEGTLIILCIFGFIAFCFFHPVAGAIILSNLSSRSGSSGIGSGWSDDGFGGFSGGGGSFGGGGASGGW